MKNKDIKLFKNNDKRDWTDEEWIEEFYQFLQGEIPDGIRIDDKESQLKLSPQQAYTVLWYLREHFPLLPDFFAQCDNCKSIYNSDNSGYYSEKGNEIGHSFCGGCDHLAPYDDEEDTDEDSYYVND